MAVKIITMEIVSKKSGKAIEVSFPMDEGFFNVSFSLPKKKRILFLTEAYREFKREEKRKRRLLSLESMLEDCKEFEDGLVDDSLNPEEQCLRNERDVLLYDAISKLNERIRFHDLRHTCATLLRHNGVPMEDISKWLGYSNILTTEQVYAHYDERKKEDTLKEMSSMLDATDEPKEPQMPDKSMQEQK